MKVPGAPARGSASGRPIMVLLDVLGQRWTLRILWELRDAPLTFRALRSRCGGISPTVLNKRLKELRAMALIRTDESGYGLSGLGRDLGGELLALSAFAERWAAALPPSLPPSE